MKEEIALAYAKKYKHTIERKLGEESNGAAYLLGNGTVLKITGDIKEVALSAKLIQEKRTAPVNAIHSIEKMGLGQYAIIQDYAPADDFIKKMGKSDDINMRGNYLSMQKKFKSPLYCLMQDMPQQEYIKLNNEEQRYVDFLRTIPNDLPHNGGDATNLDIKHAHFGRNQAGELVVFDLSDMTLSNEQAMMLVETTYRDVFIKKTPTLEVEHELSI